MDIFILLIIAIFIIWARKKRKKTQYNLLYKNNQSNNNQPVNGITKNDIINNEQTNKENNYPTKEELDKLAFNGIKDKWSVIYGRNPNLFNLMFEWIPNGEYKQILRFKQFRTQEYNYAPYITDFNEGKSFFYNNYDSLGFKVGLYGYVQIEYPCKKCFVKILISEPDKNIENDKKKIEDFTNVLEIDYSPDTIQKQLQLIKEENERRKKEQERKEIEEIKERLLKKKRKEDLEKLALRELMDEGVLFPEAGKRPPIPKEVVDAVWKRDGGKCVYCGSTENLQLDHIIPFSKGGATTVENLQLLCQKCNLQKSNKIG